MPALSGHSVAIPDLHIGKSVIRPSKTVGNLGIEFMFASTMQMESQVTAVCQAASFHLRNISHIKCYLLVGAMIWPCMALSLQDLTVIIHSSVVYRSHSSKGSRGCKITLPAGHQNIHTRAHHSHPGKVCTGFLWPDALTIRCSPWCSRLCTVSPLVIWQSSYS